MKMFIYILVFLSGASFGSFYFVVAERLLKGESIVSPPSHCTNCKRRLKWYELIPVFSFIFLKGKCKTCNTKIGINSLITEIFTGILFVISLYKYSISPEFLIAIILASILILVCLTDFSEYIILDEVIITASIAIITLYMVSFGINYTLVHIVSGLLLFVFMYLLKLFGDKVFKKESLGGGDIKLSFVIGMATSFRLGLIVLIISSFLAFPYAIITTKYKKTNEVPFGPFLASALFIVYINADKFANLLSLLYM